MGLWVISRITRLRGSMPGCVLIGLITVLLAVPSWAQLYSIERDEAALVQVNPADATSIDSVTITLAGQMITGGNGLSAQPGTFALYGLLSITGQVGRELVTIDPATGVATSIGDTGRELEGLAFDASGTLYGVTDRTDPSTERLYTLNLGDGSATEIATLDQAGIGEAIAYHQDNGLLYRVTETGKVTPPLYQSIELANPFTSSDIALSGADFAVATAMTYAGSGLFYLTDNVGGFYSITDGGVASFIGNLDPLRGEGPGAEGGLSKGLAIVPEPASFVLLGIGFVLIGSRRKRRVCD